MTYPKEWYMLPRAVRKARELVIAENKRQRDLLGFTAEHDDKQTDGSIAQAGLWYLATLRKMPSEDQNVQTDGAEWPKTWASTYCKPRNLKRDLVRGLALLLAEHWRLLRIAERDLFMKHPLYLAYCPPSEYQVLESFWTKPDVANGLNRLTNLLALTPEPAAELLDDQKNPA